MFIGVRAESLHPDQEVNGRRKDPGQDVNVKDTPPEPHSQRHAPGDLPTTHHPNWDTLTWKVKSAYAQVRMTWGSQEGVLVHQLKRVMCTGFQYYPFLKYHWGQGGF